MAKSRENGSTILLGLEGYEVAQVIEEAKIVQTKTVPGNLTSPSSLSTFAYLVICFNLATRDKNTITYPHQFVKFV